jgi:phage baseplate assembly protein W
MGQETAGWGGAELSLASGAAGTAAGAADASLESLEEALECARAVLETARGSAPGMRGFGISHSGLDMRASVAKPMMVASITEAIARHESRLSVRSVSFGGDGAGRLSPKVEVAFNG